MRWRDRGSLAAMMLAGACITSLAARAAVAPISDIQLGSRASVARDRVELAAKESIDRYGEWLAPSPASPLVIHDAPSWRMVRPAMNVEMHVAYDIARQWLGRTDSPAVNAIAWYLQSRVVERLYDYAYHQPGHSAEVAWFFGRNYATGFPSLRLSRFAKPLGRFEDAARWPDTAPIVPASIDRTVLRASMALASLERIAGWPVLQGALAEARVQAESRALSLDDLGQVLSSAMGIDAASVLAWYQRDNPVDYAVSAVASQPCERSECVRTTVSVTTTGDAPPQPLTLRVEFGGGRYVDAAWDGKQAQAFEFESTSPMSAVHLDPERVVLRDANWLNNDRLAASATNVPIGKWAARWMVWLQDAMLAYSAGL